MIRRRMLTLGAALLTAVTAGCSSPPPTLVPGLSDTPPDPAKGISGGSFSTRAKIISIEMGTYLCSVRDVQLTTVQLFRPSGGIKLARWGIENNYITLNGETEGPLAQLGPFTSHQLTRRCHPEQSYSRVGLELQRTQPGPASFLGLRITYNSDGGEKVAYLWEQYHLHNPRRSA